MHEPQISKENLHIVPERKMAFHRKIMGDSDRTAPRLPCEYQQCRTQCMRETCTKSQIWIETHSIPLCGKIVNDSGDGSSFLVA